MHSISFPTIALILALFFTFSAVLKTVEAVIARTAHNFSLHYAIVAVLWGWFYWLTR